MIAKEDKIYLVPFSVVDESERQLPHIESLRLRSGDILSRYSKHKFSWVSNTSYTLRDFKLHKMSKVWSVKIFKAGEEHAIKNFWFFICSKNDLEVLRKCSLANVIRQRIEDQEEKKNGIVV